MRRCEMTMRWGNGVDAGMNRMQYRNVHTVPVRKFEDNRVNSRFNRLPHILVDVVIEQ